jgi:CRP-like cAMP-binding protein
MIRKRRSVVRPSELTPSLNSRPPPREQMPNLLLASLPMKDYQRVSRSLDRTSLVLKAVLHKPSEPITDVYFPGGGFCSILTVLADDSMVEVATVGREGMVGVTAILNEPQGPTSLTMVQAASELAYRMPIEAFRRELRRRGPFHEVLTRYTSAHMAFVMQSTACNAKHSVEQRLSRWLLLAHDRVGADEFPLTQEFAAMMLGASRPMVSVVAGVMQKSGLISYHRGVVRIVNRRKLERSSCECYQVTTDVLAGVTGRGLAD